MSSRADLTEVAHRPWGLPQSPWSLRMVWRDLAFLHWPVSPAVLRPTLPGGIELDLYGGSAWLGVVPFVMRDVAPRAVPAMPWLSAFPEINLRTYVRVGDHAGVWFYSLDVPRRMAVWIARKLFYLPYYRASMEVRVEGSEVGYRSHRTHGGAAGARFAGRYRPAGDEFRAARGSLEEWLTERYALFSCQGRDVFRGDIHHAPWPLQQGEVELEENDMVSQVGLRALEGDPHVLFAKHLDVVAWGLRRVRGPGVRRSPSS